MKESGRIYHIAESKQWTKSLELGEYVCPSLETEGFIHFSRAEQVVATANRHYHGVNGLVLVTVLTDRLTARLKNEKRSTGEFFPHLYGPLNLDAVEKVSDFIPDASGDFKELPA